MPRKKSGNQISEILAAHVHEQVEAASKRFLSIMAMYGANGAISLILPDGTSVVYVCSENNDRKCHHRVLKKACEAMASGQDDKESI